MVWFGLIKQFVKMAGYKWFGLVLITHFGKMAGNKWFGLALIKLFGKKMSGYKWFGLVLIGEEDSRIWNSCSKKCREEDKTDPKGRSFNQIFTQEVYLQ